MENKLYLAVPLLEYLADCCGCAYLSDLRLLSTRERRGLAQKIEAIPAEAATTQEWNGALRYLTGNPPEQTAELARKRLIDFLSR